eukprot:GGOE01018213.1.p1 GENE.GGOE01018213.1~~GGOE01018213.1.p1  ORF type:complete len:264 (-),score=18.54 GGOE01018213.1:161-952(-)
MKLFERSGKDFKAIAKSLPRRSCKDCVDFYYKRKCDKSTALPSLRRKGKLHTTRSEDLYSQKKRRICFDPLGEREIKRCRSPQAMHTLLMFFRRESYESQPPSRHRFHTMEAAFLQTDDISLQTVSFLAPHTDWVSAQEVLQCLRAAFPTARTDCLREQGEAVFRGTCCIQWLDGAKFVRLKANTTANRSQSKSGTCFKCPLCGYEFRFNDNPLLDDASGNAKQAWKSHEGSGVCKRRREQERLKRLRQGQSLQLTHPHHSPP